MHRLCAPLNFDPLLQGRERAAGRKAANITVLALLGASNEACPLQMKQPLLSALVEPDGGEDADDADDDGVADKRRRLRV